MSRFELILGGADDVSKRQYGTGSVRKRGKNWQIIYRANGRQIYETVGPDKEAAELLLAERLLEIRKGNADQFLGWKFEDVALEWLDGVKATGEKTWRTTDIAETALRSHLIPALGSDFLHQITWETIERYKINKLTGRQMPVAGAAKPGRKLSPASVNHHLTVLNQLFKEQVKRKRMNVNPCSLVSRASVEKPKVEPLEPKQVKKLLKQIKDERYKLAVLLTVSLGLRIGETFAIQLQDWRSKEKVIAIRRSLQRVKLTEPGTGRVLNKVIVGTTKTTGAERDLKVSDQLAKRIDDYIKEYVINDHPEALLFSSDVSDVVNPSNFRTRVWRPALRDAGLDESLTPHILRHTAASQWISDPTIADTVIAYRLGHRDSNITRSTYAHIFARHRAQEADVAGLYDDDPVDEDSDLEAA